MTNILEVENKIITLRNQQVILDSDVAELYGVETKCVNEAVGNNPEKFPEGYVLLLTNQEKAEVVENFDHLARLRFSPQCPKAFTEKNVGLPQCDSPTFKFFVIISAITSPTGCGHPRR